MVEKNKPVHTERLGAIKATVWQNEVKGPSGAFKVYSIDLARSYKDKDGAWQSTGSMRQGDLPKAIRVMQKAQDFCWSQKESSEDKE